MNVVNILSVEDFNEIAKNENQLNIGNYEEFFQKRIVDVSNYDFRFYFWFINAAIE